MKKILLALGIVVLIAGTALAVKQINLSNTVMRSVQVNLLYDTDASATAEFIVVYDVCDADCTFITQEAKKYTWKDMPTNIKNSVANFLKHIDQDFRNEKISENNSDMVFK